MMSSRFSTFFRNHATPVLRREFNQPVDFIDRTGTEIRFSCFVDLDEIPSGEEFSDLQGKVSVKTVDLRGYVDTDGLGDLIKVRYSDELFDVYGAKPDEFGSTIFSIRRRFDQQQHSNQFDLSGTQQPYL